MKKFFTFSLVLVIIAIFFGYSFYSSAIYYSLNPNGNNQVIIDIHQGDTANDVALELVNKGLIKNADVFRFYLNQNDLSSSIKAGRIVLSESFNLIQIVNALVKGRSEQFSITFLEGWTIRQMGEYLESQNLTTADEFVNCVKTCNFDFNFIPENYLEGYLYPDTYFVTLESYSNERLIGRMIENLKIKLDKYWEDINSSNRSFEEIMTMASIVEREEKNSKERATVAGVLWNRYDVNMGIGADATVLYALGRTSGSLTVEDLAIKSPYNTRKFRGLPPTPIANPSISSILAALYPKDTPYWYYLHDFDGKVHYAKTLEGHNSNKKKYLY